MLTIDDVLQVQNRWGDCIVDIGRTYQQGGDYRKAAQDMLNVMYAFDQGGVLFKPTKATEVQFRETQEQALSYFVGGSISEDSGFALQPWSHVRFENHKIKMDTGLAIAMGNYYFTAAETGEEVQVEFTLGIRSADDGRPVIFLHHSSLPYQPEK
ncbi:MAG: hypothetical protein ACQEUB_13295 [Thermodesulfobacteriota bacterium]